MSSSLRFEVVGEAFKKKAVEVPAPAERPSEFFGKYVFTRQKMFKYLPADVYKKMCDVIDNGASLDLQTADVVAAGMKKWAMELGVTHCTHWFQPLTEGTAEKHDAFCGTRRQRRHGGRIFRQAAHPAGNRCLFVPQRGHPLHVRSARLFCLGHRFARLRSRRHPDDSHDFHLLYRRGARLQGSPEKGHPCRRQSGHRRMPLLLSGREKVISNLGWEQEYFLVDEGLYATRPDLLMTGRTLMGHESAKNQQMDDHYFGSIPERVAEFMKDLEIQALELGIPCKTRHNEVAPNQFELAPIYEETNLAVDHNMLLMSLMKKIARKHGFRCLLHEKTVRRYQRVRQTQQLVTGYRYRNPAARAGQNSDRQPAFRHLYRGNAHGSLSP